MKRREHLTEKILLLEKIPEVWQFFSKPSSLRTFLLGLSEECEYVVKMTFAIGQGESIFDVPETIFDPTSHYRQLLDDLLDINRFYSDIGGIIGYQRLILSHLVKREEEGENFLFSPPQGIDLSDEEDPKLRHAILEGIRRQEEMAELYPIGGAADRLQLKDDKTGKGLPAACLIFQGRQSSGRDDSRTFKQGSISTISFSTSTFSPPLR